ncbi:hypothetical protein [Salibacterium aidingense]|uniref:hypothetical protein n=1 Tax=Salibacterium aidingense TaxID=384933 RepID=UPI003BE3C88E
MTNDKEEQILEEIRKMNDKLDHITEKQKGLSTPMKFIALLLGFMVLGPLIAILLSFVTPFF